MMTKKMNWVAIGLLSVLGLAACDKPNSAETAGREAGREIDQAAAKTGEKMDEASKKLGEKAAKTGEVLNDAALTTKVKTAILADPDLRVGEINVDTVANVVTLTGTVDSTAKSQKAQQVAAGVSGVKEVVNRLLVKAPS